MIKKLLSLSSNLDKIGQFKLADAIDSMVKTALLDIPNLFHGTGKQKSVENILSTGLIMPRDVTMDPTHSSAPSAQGHLYLSRFPGVKGRLQYPNYNSGSFNKHPEGAMNYSRQSGEDIHSPHIFQIDLNSLDQESLSPDEDFIYGGLTNQFLDMNPGYANSLLSSIIEQINKIKEDLNRENNINVEHQKIYGKYTDPELQKLNQTMGSVEQKLKQLDLHGEDSAEKIKDILASISYSFAYLFIRRAHREGYIKSRWNENQYFDNRRAKFEKILAKKLSDAWLLSLMQYGSVRSSKQVKIERAIKRTQPTGEKGRWESMRDYDTFSPQSLEDLTGTGEWEEIPIKR